jgi:hypothetical protein
LTVGSEKLRQAILYVAWRTKDDPTFGSTKLNKTLFRADFRSYFRRARDITGFNYQAQQDGPTLVALLPVLRDLRERGIVEFDRPPAGNAGEHRVIPRDEPQRDLLTDDDITELNAAIERVQPMSAEEVSELAHKFQGWRLAWDNGRGKGTRIPLESVFLDEDEDELQEWEQEHAEVVARRAGLL